MPLLALWASNPTAIGDSTIEQIVAIAGDGILKDASSCSDELRQYFAQTHSSKLAAYVDHCLQSSFNKGGMVLQDLVNELGRRLDYKVANGRYQGVTNGIGFDGIWVSPEGHTIVAEVKTTDAYRISLDTIGAYRERLLATSQIANPSSVLIIVGRQDTGELEAQIRGSRHAWDVRVISTDSLVKLVQLKENSDSPDTGLKIRSLLAPMEYTRLDKMVDVMFTTATDVEAAIVEAATGKDSEEKIEPQADDGPKGVWQFTEMRVLDNKRDQIIATVSKTVGATLIRKSRALYWDSAHEKRVACSISKRYTKRTSYPYWYAYHPQWDDFLKDGHPAYFVLGCMDLPFAFSIPHRVLIENLDALNTTTTDRSTYWHIHLVETKNKGFALLLPKRSSQLPLDEFRIDIGT